MTPLPFPAPGEVHILQASLSAAPLRWERLKGSLSEEELRRGGRLRDPEIGQRFLIGRGILREILAGYLALRPQAVRLREGSRGKPYLADCAPSLQFNLSHSGDLLLVAVTTGSEVGVDLEKVRGDLPFPPMARHFFSTAECESLFRLPTDQQLSAFYRCWTRKEAYLKGTGTGFCHPSNAFDVSLSPGAPPALLKHRTVPDEVGRWILRDLEVPGAYCAALAVAGELHLIRQLPHDYSGSSTILPLP